MAGGVSDDETTYNSISGFIFVFNLVIGAGALTLPLAFSQSGLILGSLFLCFMAFLSYITATWVVEALSIANAHKKCEKNIQDSYISPSDLYGIDERIEYSALSELYIGNYGQKFFYFIMIVYLYGDLSIYAVSVPLSLKSFTGSLHIGHLNLENPYYFYVALFAGIAGPFCFFNFQGTKYFQYVTMFTRNSALFLMIILALIWIGKGNGAAAKDLRYFELNGIPNLFGTAVYSFMCHHSIPSIVKPIENKSSIHKLFGLDYMSINLAYLLLSISAVFAFGTRTKSNCSSGNHHPCHLQDLYTQNFLFENRGIADYIVLFPVFTLSSNFPLIAITLRNNIQVLWFRTFGDPSANVVQESKWISFFRRNMFTLIAIIPPILIALVTTHVDNLVSWTGAFAGLFIQLVIPASLVYNARRMPLKRNVLSTLVSGESVEAPLLVNSEENYGSTSSFDDVATTNVENVHIDNPFKSPFQHVYWIYFVWIFSIITFGVNIYNQVKKYS